MIALNSLTVFAEIRDRSAYIQSSSSPRTRIQSSASVSVGSAPSSSFGAGFREVASEKKLYFSGAC